MASYNPHGYSSGRLPWGGHVCGLYYITPLRRVLHRTYLPQVELEAHATILATTSRTVLTQTFVNPSTEKGIREVRYTFPLYDGVSVVGFTCHVGDRTIVGEVKEKDKARAVFQEAVAKGETAGLLEQLPDASDVFTTTVGNIAPGARLVVKITYLGELKHDMEVDGTRFTIPRDTSSVYCRECNGERDLYHCRRGDGRWLLHSKTTITDSSDRNDHGYDFGRTRCGAYYDQGLCDSQSGHGRA
jgi:hypothetical protein